MKLGFGFDFKDFNNIEGLNKLDSAFWNYYGKDKKKDLVSLNLNSLSNREYSNFIISTAQVLEKFLSLVFNLNSSVDYFYKKALDFNIIYECRRKFVQRIALNKYPEGQLLDDDLTYYQKKLELIIGSPIDELEFAQKVSGWLKEENKYQEYIDLAARYASLMANKLNCNSILFAIPKKNNSSYNKKIIDQLKSYNNSGFNYISDEFDDNNALSQACYCIYCHNQDKDYCSKGKSNKINTNYKHSEPNTGCPLKQKISEMNFLKARGFNIGALATVMIDNPLLVVTGHRICNDCIKSCIYTNQEQVNVPLVESNVLNSVLMLPYGVEIYCLLSKWNPLKINDPIIKESTGYKVLVVGSGPSGFSLAYYLLYVGHNVVMIDGSKISPIKFDINSPIKYWSDFKEDLSKRKPYGFGGVLEYGVTTRWDKNNLTLIRILLERMSSFKVYGSIKFKGNITGKQAFRLGFDHIAVCTGASSVNIPNDLTLMPKGVKMASDFLMNLQSFGAFLEDSNNSLTIRLPIVLIGGGLTVIDSAVEVLKYYPVQVERFLSNYELLAHSSKIKNFNQCLNTEDKTIVKDFIKHAKLFRKQKNKEDIEKIILEKLGGVTVYHKGDLEKSKAYITNKTEVLYAIARGIKFVKYFTLNEINIDKFGYLNSINFNINKVVQARTLLVATGVNNNSNIRESNRKYSYFGDCAKDFSGSIVKILSNSKIVCNDINKILKEKPPKFLGSYKEFFKLIDSVLTSTVTKVCLLQNGAVEIELKSALIAKNLKPGQFFRFDIYNNKVSLNKPLVLTGVKSNAKKGLIKLVVLDKSIAQELYENILEEDKVLLMGPNGSTLGNIKNMKVLFITDNYGTILINSIGKKLKKDGCSISSFIFYKSLSDILYKKDVESFSKKIIWINYEQCFTKIKFRKEDLYTQGSILEIINNSYMFNFIKESDQVIITGSNKFVFAITEILKGELSNINAKVVCYLNTPMQCMLGGICGHCIQKSAEGYIFACSNNKQDIALIDVNYIKSRCEQNKLQEQLIKNLRI